MKCYSSFINNIQIKNENTIYNKELCPYFWDNDMVLNQRVKNKLLNIANDFISSKKFFFFSY